MKKKKQPINWDKLLEYGLLPEIPSDSMYQSGMVKEKTPDSPFIYRVNLDGEVTKEVQHVTYEIVVASYEKVTEEFDEAVGDINKAKMCGEITKPPAFNILGENSMYFVNINIGAESHYFDGHMFYNNAIAWGKNAQNIF